MSLANTQVEEAPYFDGSGFQEWKQKMLRYIENFGSLDIKHLNERCVLPKRRSSWSEEDKRRHKIDSRMRCIFVKALSDKVFAKAYKSEHDCISAYDMWIKLKHVYENESTQVAEESFMTISNGHDGESDPHNKEESEDSEDEEDWSEKLQLALDKIVAQRSTIKELKVELAEKNSACEELKETLTNRLLALEETSKILDDITQELQASKRREEELEAEVCMLKSTKEGNSSVNEEGESSNSANKGQVCVTEKKMAETKCHERKPKREVAKTSHNEIPVQQRKPMRKEQQVKYSTYYQKGYPAQRSFRGNCYCCGQIGHKAARCRHAPYNRKEQMNRNPFGQNKRSHWFRKVTIECYRCGKRGHIARQCLSILPQQAARKSEQLVREDKKEGSEVIQQIMKLEKVSQPKHELKPEIKANLAEVLLKTSDSQHTWIVDSGCTSHMTGNRNLLNMNEENKKGSVRFGNNGILKVKGRGQTKIQGTQLNEIQLVEGLKHNLLSVSKLCSDGHEIMFTQTDCLVKKCGNVVARGTRSKGGLYQLQSYAKETCYMNQIEDNWHQKLKKKRASVVYRIVHDPRHLKGVDSIK